MSEYVTITELAKELQRERTVVKKYCQKNGFNLEKIRTPASRWQLTYALTHEDAEAVRQLRRAQGFTIPKERNETCQSSQARS